MERPETPGSGPVTLDVADRAVSTPNTADNVKLYGYLVQQPISVYKRLNALKRVQLDQLHDEAGFWHTLHALQKEYNSRQARFRKKRRAIVEGTYEPTEQESTVCPGDSFGAGIDDDILNYHRSRRPNDGRIVSGVPNFWLNVLMNCSDTRRLITKADEEALTSLVDIDCEYTSEPDGFILSFHFGSNDYFTNAVLTKQYEVCCHVDVTSPFTYEGPEVVSRKGCEIQWKPGKNLTVMIKKITGKGRTAPKLKEVPVSSFFDFFSPAYDVSSGDEIASTVRDFLYEDFEIALALRDRVIRRAVLYFTGEVQSEDEDSYGSEESAAEDSTDSWTS